MSALEMIQGGQQLLTQVLPEGTHLCAGCHILAAIYWLPCAGCHMLATACLLLFSSAVSALLAMPADCVTLLAVSALLTLPALLYHKVLYVRFASWLTEQFGEHPQFAEAMEQINDQLNDQMPQVEQPTAVMLSDPKYYVDPSVLTDMQIDSFVNAWYACGRPVN